MSPSSSFSGSPFGGSTRTLRKTSSFADLAKRQLRRFKSKGDFDFGCQGDHNQEIVEEEPEEEEVQEVRAFSQLYCFHYFSQAHALYNLYS